MNRKDIITLATNRGHSVSKAIEIAFDFERGDDFTVKWVHCLEQDNWPLRQKLSQ